MKFLSTILITLFLLTSSVHAGILTNNGNVDWDTSYYGISIDTIDNIFFRSNDDGTSEVIVITRRVGLSVPEFWNWISTHSRTGENKKPSGTPAELVDNKIRFNTSYMFQDMVYGCQGLFQLAQNEIGITQTYIKNDRNIKAAVQAVGKPLEIGTPSNLPCMGTSVGFKDFKGQAYLRVQVLFPADKKDEYIDLAVSVNDIIPLNSDEGSFDKALAKSDDPVLPKKLFSSK